MPRALLRSPRTLRRKRGTLGPLLLGRISTAPVLAVCAATIAFALLDPIVVFLFPAQPAHVIGQRRSYKPHRGISFDIEYQFDQSGFIGQDDVLPSEYQTFHIGQSISAHLIHLGPLDYSTLDRSARAYARNRSILWFGATFALAIGGVLFYAIWLLPWRSHWLAKNGHAAFGAVVEKSIVHGSRRHLFFTLTYQFKASGILHANRIRVNSHRYDSADVQDLVIILYDPARPTRNIVYDYCNFLAS
jgi:hypothetical protein